MYEATLTAASAIESYSRTFRAKLTFEDGYEIGGDTNRVIVDFKLLGGGCTTHDIQIGSTVCSIIDMNLGYTETVPLTRRDCALSIGILTDDGFEYIPFGKYVVNSVDSSSGHTVLTLADFMYKLDRDYKTEIVFPNTLENIIADIAAQFHFTYDVGDLRSLVIGSVPVGLSYRNIVGHIAAMVGKFAIFDRNGVLRFEWYEEADYTINNDIIEEPTISEADYVVGFLDVQLADGSYKTLPEEAESEQGISIANPFMSDSAMQIAWNTVKDFAYRPANVKMLLGDPRIDPWDILTLVVSGVSYSVPVMSLTYEYDGGLSCDIAATATTEDSEYQTPAQRQQSQTQAEIQSATYVIYASNALDLDIARSEKRLLRLTFAVTENATPYMIATIQANLTEPGTVLFEVTVNGSAYAYHRQICNIGDNLITFMVPFVSLSTTGSHSVEILVSSDDAKGTILINEAKAVLTGSGTSGASTWDGLISVTDGYAGLNIPIPAVISPEIAEILENAGVALIQPGETVLQEFTSPLAVSLPQIPAIHIDALYDANRLYPVVHQCIIYTDNEAEYLYNRTYVDTSESAFKLRKTYVYNGEAETVDSGQLTTVELPLSDFESVTGLEVDS